MCVRTYSYTTLCLRLISPSFPPFPLSPSFITLSFFLSLYLITACGIYLEKKYTYTSYALIDIISFRVNHVCISNKKILKIGAHTPYTHAYWHYAFVLLLHQYTGIIYKQGVYHRVQCIVVRDIFFLIDSFWIFSRTIRLQKNYFYDVLITISVGRLSKYLRRIKNLNHSFNSKRKVDSSNNF